MPATAGPVSFLSFDYSAGLWSYRDEVDKHFGQPWRPKPAWTRSLGGLEGLGKTRRANYRAITRRMLMRTLILRAVALAVVLSPALVFTQGGKTKPTTATYITKEEIDIVNSQGQGIDRNIKTVDIGHENFSVGIIHRGK